MAGYIGSTPVPQATQHRETFTATNGQTSFATVGYTPQFLDVYLNGVKLAPADFTATNGSDVILTSGATTNDILEVVAYTPFEVANQTFTGTTTAANLTVTGAFNSQGIDDNANAVAITIDSSENVGIGSASDGAILQLDRASSSYLDIQSDSTLRTRIYNDSSQTILETTTNNLIFKSASSEAMRITSAGNVGIGTTSPRNASGFVGLTLDDTSGSFIDFNDSGVRVLTISGNATGNDINTVTAIPLRFKTNNSEAMRLDASGNLLVGKTSSSGVKMDVLATASDNLVARFENSHATGSYGISVKAGDDSGNYAADFANKSGTSLMRIRGDGNVGIGTTSPSTRLTVGAGVGSEEIRVDAGAGWADLTLNSNATNGGHIYFNDGSNAGEIFYYHPSDYMVFSTAGTERIRITSSGSVGIGTSSPSTALHIEGANGDLLTVKAASGSEFTMHVDGNEISLKADADNDEASSVMTFDIDGSEAMRLDAIGRLLVGKTTQGLSTAGFEVEQTGQISVTQSGASCIRLNRLSSDGAIIQLRKDTSQVGIIGTYNSATGIISGSAASYTGIYLNTNKIEPAGNNFGSEIRADNTVDIGSSSYRFKDLYLSGGVYLGGTGSANHLEDYEEGTWTLVPPTGVSISTTGTGRYTKVGRKVTVSGLVSATSISGSAYFDISGLPFTSGPNSYANSTQGVMHQHITAQQIQAFIGNNNSYIRFYACDGGAWDRLQANQVSTASDIYFTITYEAA